MDESRIVLIGQYAGKAKGETAIAVPGYDNFQPQIKARLRGPYPNYGSGPWFSATKDAELTYTNGSFVPGWGVESQGYVGFSAYGANSYLLRAVKYVGRFMVTMAFEKQIVGFGTDKNGNLILNYLDRGGNVPQAYWVDVTPGDYDGWLSAARRYLSSLAWITKSVIVRYKSGSWGNSKKLIGYKQPSFNFRNNELDTFQWAAEFGILVNGSASRWATAYSRAVENLDITQVNSLANVLSAAEAIVGLAKLVRNIFKGDFGRIAADLKSAADPRNLWLSYRYVYKTSKADLEDYSKMIQRLGDLANAGTKLSTSGGFSDETGDYLVKLSVNTDDVIPKNTVEFLAAIGVEPNAQNIWDLIPYSFVVDWFFHISDLMEWVDKWGNAIDFPIADCWCIYRSAYDAQSVYYRVAGRRPDIPPIYVSKEASSRTIGMRVADSLSLFTIGG
jgi:hypothetical protein